MIGERSLRRHRRIYGALLAFYPPTFRREFGQLMAQAFCDRLREKGGRRTWGLIIPDLLQSVPQQITEVPFMSQKWMAAITALSSVALLTALAIGAGPPLLLAGATVVALGLLAVLSAKRAGRPTEYLYGGSTPRAWTWWTVLATLLATTYVLAGIGQLINDPKPTHLGALAIITGFAGLIVAGLRLRARSKIAGNWMVIFATVPALMFWWVIVPALVAVAIIVGAVAETTRATPRVPSTT